VFQHIGLNNTSHIRLDDLTAEFGPTTKKLHHLKAVEVRKTDHLQIVNSEIIGHEGTKDWQDVPRGIQVWDGSSNIELIDNHFHHLGRAVLILGVKDAVIKENLIDDMYSDGLFFQNSSNVLIENNLLTDFNRSGTVHADYIQFDAGRGTPSHDVVIRGNLMLKGNGNGDVQGIFGDAGDYDEIHKSTFKNFLIEDNIYFDTGMNGFHFWSGENMILRNNTVLMDPSTTHPNNPSRILMRGPQTNSLVENNVALQVSAEGGSKASGNVIVQFKDPSKANHYGKLFADAFADPATLADLAPKAGTPVGYGSGKGAEKLFQELLDGEDPAPANRAPEAGDDAASTAQGAPVTIKVLANDHDADGDTLTLKDVSQPDNGTVTRNADNTATYTPKAGFTGSDSFTYTVSDGKGGTDTGRATVSVAGDDTTLPTPLLASAARSFDGTKDATLILPHQPSYAVAAGTVELAFTADSVSGVRGLFSKDALNYGTGGHLTIHVEDGDLVVRLQNTKQSFTLNADNAITAGQLHHAAVTFGPGGFKLYLDGVQKDAGAYTGGIGGNAEPVVIGARQVNSGKQTADVLSDFFDGTIAKAALYDRALPAATIAELHADLAPTGSAPDKASPPDGIAGLSLWLDAADPATVEAGEGFIGRWLDKSGNGHDAVQADSGRQAESGDGSLLFDGSDDYFAIADAADLNIGGPYTGKTLTFAFTTGADVSSRQVIYEEGGTARGLNLYLDNGKLHAGGWNVPETPWEGNVDATIAANTFYVASLVFDADAGTFEGFLDGTSMGSVNGIGKLHAHSADIGLGAMNQDTWFHDGAATGTGHHFSGQISQAAFYGHALDDAERQSLETYFQDDATDSLLV
jgi:Bacterial Ig domain/Concanavalin A-like lectin/glucanases superfamily/Right handed beta helix region